MKRKLLLILGIVLSSALCFSGCDTGLFDFLQDEGPAGVADDYRVSRMTQTSNGNTYTSTYEYVSGRKIDKTVTTMDGSPYSTTVYSYNSDNTRNEVTTTYTDSSSPVTTVRYSNYNSHGSFLRIENYFNGTLGSYFEFTYEYDISDKIVSSIQKAYDAAGNLSSTTESYFEDWKIVRSEMTSAYYNSVTTMKYDSHGCIIESSTTGTATMNGSSSTSTSTTTFTNEYSLAGNLVKQTQEGGSVIEYEYEKF